MECSASNVFKPSKRFDQLERPLEKNLQKPAALLTSSEKENFNPNLRCDPPARVKKPIGSFDPYVQYHAAILNRFSESVNVNVSVRDPFAGQMQVTKRMKRILLNWVISVHIQYKLNQRTLFLFENVLVRYISAFPVYKNNFQLLGIACLWIASKVEDVYPPNISDLWKVALNKFSLEEILQAEQEILLSNKFELMFVSAYDIAESLLYERKIANLQIRPLASLIMEVHLFAANVRAHNPFDLAIFSINLAFTILKVKDTISLDNAPGGVAYQEKLLISTQELVHFLGRDQLFALREKYAKAYIYLENFCLI